PGGPPGGSGGASPRTNTAGLSEAAEWQRAGIAASGVPGILLRPLLDGVADVDPWLGHPELADLQRAHAGVEANTARALTRQPLGGEPAHPAGDEDALHEHDEDGRHDEQRDDRLHEGVGYEQQHQQDEQPVHVELADSAAGIDVVTREGLDRAAVPERKRPGPPPAQPPPPAGAIPPPAGPPRAGRPLSGPSR